MKKVLKRYLKCWAVAGYFQYEIYEIDAGGEKWLEATPKTPGMVTRTAENETVLRIILVNDARNYVRSHQKVR